MYMNSIWFDVGHQPRNCAVLSIFPAMYFYIFQISDKAWAVGLKGGGGTI